MLSLTLAAVCPLRADGGSRLWLPTADSTRTDITLPHSSAALHIAANELRGGAWKGGAVTFVLKKDRKAHPDSFSIRQEEGKTTLASPTETGLLYAAYHLLRLQQTQSLPADSGTRVWTESPASDNFTCPDATLLNQVR